MPAETAEIEFALVEWVYDHSDRGTLGDAELAGFVQAHGLTLQEALRLMEFCKEKGFLSDGFITAGGLYANLTALGEQVVSEKRRRRSDPLLRAAAARKALLDRLWQVESGLTPTLIAALSRTPGCRFEGEPIRAAEFVHAAEDLVRKGLARWRAPDGDGCPELLMITAAGGRCAEHYGGDVDQYEREREAGRTVFNIGSNTGNIAAGSTDFQMTAVTTHRDRMAEVAHFARALRQAVPVLGLPDDGAREMAMLAERLLSETAGDEPDPTRLQRWSGRVLELLNSPLMSGTLGGVLAAYGQTVLPGLPGGS